MKQPLILSLVITLLCGIYGYHLNAQESINPLVQCAETITLKASPTRGLRSGSTSPKELEGAEFSFSSEEQTHPIYALAVDLSVTFTSKEGYFSILFEDQAGKQYLVYRDIAIFNQLNKPISLSNKAFETALFAFGVHPKKLTLRTSGCVVNLDKVHTATSHNNNTSKIYQLRRFYTLKQDAIQSQIDRINAYNKEHKILWVAKQTSLSLRPYAENRQNLSFLDEVDAYGLEHYGGGIYTPMATPFDEMEFLDTTTYPYVDYFDWSDRHGINWNTPSRWQQGTESCWAQAAASAMDSYIKRYYGDEEDRPVSVLQIIACSEGMKSDSVHQANCGPGFVGPAMEYLSKEYIVSEDDFLFKGKKYQPCENKPSDPLISYRVEKTNHIGWFDREKVMHILINQGPMSISTIGHAMLLTGYGVVKEGKILDYWASDVMTISKDHPLYGKVYWSMKNSFGKEWGNGGYSYFVRVKYNSKKKNTMFVSDFGDLYYLSGKLYTHHNPHFPYIRKVIQAYDKDGDGYYRWGLVGKPDNPYIVNLQDGDDSDPLAGPMNEYGVCQELRKTDLYIRDVKQDRGVEPYTIEKPQWESPDIWIRQNPDGIEEHQNPDFGKSKKCYVYLRVHNKGITPSNARAQAWVYWSYASPTQWSNSFHGKETIIRNGKSIQTGGKIGSAKIPIIPANSSAIVNVEWELPKDFLLSDGDKNVHACLLAELDNSQDPYFLTDSSDFRLYVQANNNVAQKNVHIINVSDGDLDNSYIDNLLIINHGNSVGDYDLILDRGDDDLQNYATIKDQLELSYQSNLRCKTKIGEGMPALSEFIPIDSVTTIKDVHLEPNECVEIKLKANFLVQNQTEQKDFTLRVRAIDQKTGVCVGGNTYIIRKSSRPIFHADATLVNDYGKAAKYVARDIGEDANYTWITSDGKEVAKGKEFSLTSRANIRNVTLSVEASKDGFLDRKTIALPILQESENNLLTLYPNPTEGMLTVKIADVRQNGVITISSAQSGRSYLTIATRGAKELSVDISALAQGNYLLTYYDGDTLIATQELHKL